MLALLKGKTPVLRPVRMLNGPVEHLKETLTSGLLSREAFEDKLYENTNTEKYSEKMLPKNTKNKIKPMRMARDPHTSKPTHSKHGKDMSLSAVTKQ